MKNNHTNFIIFLIFNIFALPLLFTGILFKWFIDTSTLYLFNQVGSVAVLMCFAFGLTLVGIMFYVLAVFNDDFNWFAPNAILIPLVIMLVFIGMFDYSKTYKIELDDYNQTIIVDTFHSFDESSSILYQRTSPITVKRICFVPNSSAWTFERKCDYKIREYENGIIITYYDKYELYLKYENKCFYKVENKEEIINASKNAGLD